MAIARRFVLTNASRAKTGYHHADFSAGGFCHKHYHYYCVNGTYIGCIVYADDMHFTHI